MRITDQYLKAIIQEELKQTLDEGPRGERFKKWLNNKVQDYTGLVPNEYGSGYGIPWEGDPEFVPARTVPPGAGQYVDPEDIRAVGSKGQDIVGGVKGDWPVTGPAEPSRPSWGYVDPADWGRADLVRAPGTLGLPDDLVRRVPRSELPAAHRVPDADSDSIPDTIDRELLDALSGEPVPLNFDGTRWTPDIPRNESKQHLRALVLQELEQMRLKEAHGGRLPRAVGRPDWTVTGAPRRDPGLDSVSPSMETILPDDVVMTRSPGESARFEVGGDDPFGEEEDVGADWWAEPSEHDWNVLDQSVGEDIFDPELDPVNPRTQARRYGTARPWGADRRAGPVDRGADVSDFGRVNENKELARWTIIAGIK